MVISASRSVREPTKEEIIVLRKVVEPDHLVIFDKMIHYIGVLEARISVLERQLREMRGNLGENDTALGRV